MIILSDTNKISDTNKNKAHRIARAINSIKNIVDEIIIIDNCSNDDTVSICKKLGAKVVFNECYGYVKQKSFGESICSHDWILNIDADEELTPELQQEIREKFSSSSCDDYNVYGINLVILHRNDKKARFLAPANRFIGLYDRKFCSFANTTKTKAHESVTLNGDTLEKVIVEKDVLERVTAEKDVLERVTAEKNNIVFNLKNPVYHRSATSIEQLINKANFYSSEQTKDMISFCRKPSLFRIAFEFPLCFLKAFLIRRYFVFRFDGFVDSIILTFARFVRLAKTRGYIFF